MNNCQRFESALEQAWLDGDGALLSTGEWNDHLEQCAACAQALKDHQSIRSGVQEVRRSVQAQPDGDRFLERLWHSVDQAPEKDQDPVQELERPSWLPLAAAALLVLGAWFGLRALLGSSGGQGNPEPTDLVADETRVFPETTPESVPVGAPGMLVLDLSDVPEGSLVGTLEILGREPDPEALLAIWQASHALDALQGPDSDQQEQLLRKLSSLGPALMVEPLARAAVRSDDLRQSRAGLRLLGARGNARSTAVLLRSVRIPSLRPAALAALADFGVERIPLTTEVFLDPDLGPLVDQRLAGASDWQVKEMLLRLARNASQEAVPLERVRAWMHLVVEHGDQPLGLLEISLPSQKLLRESMLDAFCTAPAVVESLENAMLARATRTERELLMELVSRVQPPSALGWLVERAEISRDRIPACQALASMDTPQAAHALLDLVLAIPAAGDAVLAAWRAEAQEEVDTGFARLQQRHHFLASELCRTRDRLGMRVFASLLEAAASPATTPAALLLAQQDLLESDRRSDLLRSTLPHLVANDLPALAVLVDQASAGSTRLLALALLGVDSAQGQDGLAFVLGNRELAEQLHQTLHLRTRTVRDALYILEQQLRDPSVLRTLRSDNTVR
ncbi:MAG TPA: hypothetical protein EYQ25_05450 [Planctomycetes bacterium]|nr:hypothetical protein [Planctomycetota bacterium]HIL36157.1 hypothetical protein [Planctomycetota bacterium]